MTGGGGRLLLLGGTGQIGRGILARAAGLGIECAAPPRRELDLTDARALGARVAETSGIGLVVNAAAYTAVDRAEAEPGRAFAVNAGAVASLAASCAARDLPLIHLSTDYVFDGARGEPWPEDAPVAPLGVYGASKAAGELAIRAVLPRHIILRTSGVFSAQGPSFVHAMVRRARGRQAVRVVADQTTCPSWAEHVAEAALRIAARCLARRPVAWGTYHYCDRPAVAWHEFAAAIFAMCREAGIEPPPLEPIPSAEYAAKARRPAHSVLDCRRIAAQFGIEQHSWREPLPRIVADLAATLPVEGPA